MYREDAEYFLVKGWFDDTSGLYEGKFYGAVYLPEDPLRAVPVVLDGTDAKLACYKASVQSHKLPFGELQLEMCSSGAIADRPAPLGGVIQFTNQDILMSREEKPKTKKKPRAPRRRTIPTISQTGGHVGGNPQ